MILITGKSYLSHREDIYVSILLHLLLFKVYAQLHKAAIVAVDIDVFVA